MANFPDQCIPEIEKNKDYGIKCIRYGLSLLDLQDGSKNKVTNLYKSYNGDRSSKSIEWITKTYGKESRAVFTSYKVGRAKQYLLEGEWLRRPLNATVKTINIQAKSDKMDHVDLMYGAMLAKDELGTLKDVAGVDVMEGAPVPQDEDDPLWQKMSPKDKQEDIMQIIVNEQIKSLQLIKIFGDNFKDARIAAICWGKIEINENGDVVYIRFDPRDRICEEIEGDDFCERSVIKGGRRWIPVHEALLRYTLTDEDRQALERCRDTPNSDARYKFKAMNGSNYVEEVHVEWKSVKPSYYKIMPKTENQLAYDSETTTVTNEIPAEVYEKNKARYDKGVARGDFKIEVKYEEDLWEGTSLGRMVFVNIRRKPFQLRPFDDPAKILDSSYVGCLFGTTDGVRVSLQELIENYDIQFDINQFKITQELLKYKGKVLGYDLAGIPKNKTLVKLIQEMTDDGIITYNSMAAGNLGGKNLQDLNSMLQEKDLGFSQGFQSLLAMQNTILSTLDRITGINEFREGSVPSSSTVTNAQQGLQNSRTITEPLFYMMQLFQQKVMHRIVEATKISWAFYKLDKGEQILGTEKFKYMQVTRELGYRDYGVRIEDGSAYLRLREKAENWMELGLNSKEIAMVDAAKFELAESTVEALGVLTAAEESRKKFQQESQQRELAMQQQIAKQQSDTQIGIARENREDLQAAALDEIEAKKQAQIEIDNNKVTGKMHENQQKIEGDLLAGI